MDFEFIINPKNTTELVRFYAFWVFVFFSIHLLLDKFSRHTSKDNWKNLRSKVTELYSASTLANSLFLFLIMVNGANKHPFWSNDSLMVPLLLSAFTGIIVGFSELVPKPSAAPSTQPQSQPTAQPENA